MRTKILIAALCMFFAALMLPGTAFADGIIIPDPPVCDPFPCPPEPPGMQQLVIRYHHVNVNIENQIATTHVDQVFYNPNDWQVEGEYVFPVPVDAAVSSFTLWIDGEPVQGEVLDANRARGIYEDIVRRMRDPALLEYAGQGALRARIFPIPPQGERRIELEYTQVLSLENGLARYVYPLNTEKFSLWPLESVTVNVDVRDASPIRAVYSPSHPIGVTRESDRHVTAGYEASDVLPDTDFALYYSLGEEQAFHLLSYRDPEDPDDPDGYFLLLLAPQADVESERLPKDVILVLDRSGSMEGEKFRQAQDAAAYILENLHESDRFNLISFSTGVELFAPELRPASEAGRAIDWVERLSAQGSTDINRALLEAAALSDRERPAYLIFLTDGLPTEGVIESQQILDNLSGSAPSNLRLFAFGVGYDVDTFLLDSLASGHHGNSTYVLPGERLDEILSAFYARISSPVLTGLDLDFGDMAVYDLYPQPLPDLFAGSQIIVVGRYRQGGTTDVLLNGQMGARQERFRYPEVVFERNSAGNTGLAAIPRLWATRKIGHLLALIRLQGPDEETIEQIVRLSIRHGIVTPYTSYLVTEEAPLGAAQQERIVEEQLLEAEGQALAPAYGQSAVEKAAGQGALADAQAPAAIDDDARELLRVAGSRTYLQTDGVWIDTAFDPDKMQAERVEFLSEAYFKLLEANPQLSPAFGLGTRVIVLIDGRAFEVIDSGEGSSTSTNPPPADSGPGEPSPQPTLTPAGQDLPSPTEVEPSPADQGGAAPGSLPCGSSLVSITLLPLFVFAGARRRKRS